MADMPGERMMRRYAAVTDTLRRAAEAVSGAEITRVEKIRSLTR
jgi:hypothetical protein